MDPESHQVTSSSLKALDELPLKQRLFVLGYLQHKGDKTKAARFAGYKRTKYVEAQGRQLYEKLRVYIEPLAKEMVQAYALSAEQVVQGLSLIAGSDIRDYLSWDGEDVRIKASTELTPQQAYCIESVKQVETQWNKTIELRLAKKQPALDCLMEYHGQYRRRPQDKGLKVIFMNGGGPNGPESSTAAKIQAPPADRLKVTFTTIPPGTNPKTGNGHD